MKVLVYDRHVFFDRSLTDTACAYSEATVTAPSMVMIENYRTGLLWKLLMANPEIGVALDKIGFVPDPRTGN